MARSRLERNWKFVAAGRDNNDPAGKYDEPRQFHPAIFDSPQVYPDTSHPPRDD